MIVPFPILTALNKQPNHSARGQAERNKMIAVGNITALRRTRKAFCQTAQSFSKVGVPCSRKIALFA